MNDRCIFRKQPSSVRAFYDSWAFKAMSQVYRHIIRVHCAGIFRIDAFFTKICIGKARFPRKRGNPESMVVLFLRAYPAAVSFTNAVGA